MYFTNTLEKLLAQIIYQDKELYLANMSTTLDSTEVQICYIVFRLRATKKVYTASGIQNKLKIEF